MRDKNQPEQGSQSVPARAAGPYLGASTRSVHAGEHRSKPYHSLIDPIFQASTFTFDNLADAIAYQQTHIDGVPPINRFDYGRYGNPTIAAVEVRLASLEHAGGAILVASGMAAITSTLLTLLSAGTHIVLTDDSYRRSREFCEGHLKRLGVTCSVVPFGDYDALEAAIRPETRVLFSETPTNPYIRILDVARFAEIGKRRHILTLIDTTFSTPINLTPLDFGVDLVIQSATKYLGGHNDLLAGVIAGRAELINPLRESISTLGAISDPNSAYLLSRGLKTLNLRLEQQNNSGQWVAEFLESHPKVQQVWYPWLKSHPDYNLGIKQMKGFGGVVSLTIKGGLEETIRFIDSLQIPYISPSLGGVESLVMHVASMAYPDVEPQERLNLGIPDNLVRLSLGIENTEDIISDLEQALDKI